MAAKIINLTLKVWRQDNAGAPGRFETYPAKDISTDCSFLEMLDIVNARIEREGKDPITFDHDCREGICGTCGAAINGQAHGPQKETTLCQLHMRQFKDGQTLVIEPFRAKAFPLLKDLAVDRSSLDRIIVDGGYVSVRTGAAPDAHAVAVKKENADNAMDAAVCIGCGACVASCPNASAMLFVSAKVSHLGLLPQGEPEKWRRVAKMARRMDAEGFGNCSNEYECEAACPEGISVRNIARLNRQLLAAAVMAPASLAGG